MPQYFYKAKDNKGQIVTGTLEAEATTQVISRLQGMGYFPVSVQTQAEASRAAGGAAGAQQAQASRRRVKIEDIATFNRQLADLLGSGIALVKALSIIQNQTQNAALQSIITQITQDVSAGDSLAGAMSKHPRIFSKLYCAMVKAGETGGLLDQVLQRLAEFSESEAETRSKIKSALAYPAVMVVAGTGAVIVLLTFVMPKILSIYTELNQSLPLPTEILLQISGFLRNYWYIALAVVGGLITAFWQALRTKEGRRAIDKIVVQLPLFGPMIVKKEVANFARTLGSLLHNGVNILPALDITQDVLTNQVVADEVAKIPLNVTQGEGIAGPLRKSLIFPPVVVNMIAIGEETGRLDDVLLKISRSYDTEVDRAVKTLTSLIEPVIILMMGVVVGFIVISMLLPIFNIDPSAQG